ncbi:MAG: 3-dehydroquinate synthase [Litorimonas sp.]
MNPNKSSQSLTVGLGERSYDIHIGAGQLANLGGLIEPFAATKRVAVITDETVHGLYGEVLAKALSGYSTHMIVRPAGEAQKSMTNLEEVLDSLFRAGFDRSDLLIAFGGGVIGDLAGFAASIYKRGMPFIQVPTTLLSQVDSSVGGKTAINNQFGKNLVGAFYQPRAVITDTDLLSTLPPRELKAGYAEVLKYGLLGDAAFFEELDAGLGKGILALDPAALSRAIYVSCATKAKIVAQDERESGVRALLNLGHTFGHALELEAGYDGDLLHGEAVSAGMEMAFRFAASEGLCKTDSVDRVSAHLSATAMPRIADMTHLLSDSGALLRHMGQDKKNEGGKLTLILPRAIGETYVEKSGNRDAVLGFLTQLKDEAA